MANELKFGNKVVFLNGLPLTLPVAASNPGSAVAGDMYYNSTSTVIRYYNGSAWTDLATGGAAANLALSNLSSVAINTSLLPGTDASINLGSSSKSWLAANIATLNAADASVSIDAYGRSLKDSAASIQLAWSTSGVAFSQLTATTVPFLNASKILTSSAVTPTELGFLSGVTSAIQTQLGAKISADGSVTFTANQPMGGFKLTGLAAGSANGDSVRFEQAVLTSGANAITGNQSFSGTAKITNLVDPTAAQDGATKAYVDSAVAGLSWKQAVVAASTANVSTSSAPSTLDGVTLTSGDRILLKNQSTASQNGIYVFSSAGAALTRSSDADTWNEIVAAVLYVEQGTLNTGAKFVNTNVPGGTLGSTAITFTTFAAASAIDGTGTAGYNAYWTATQTLAAEQFVSAARGGLAADASAFSGVLKASAGVFSASSIVNADISSSAAIALSKLAALTVSRALQSNASTGVIEVSSVTNTELGYLSGVTSAIQTQLGGKANTALSNLASTAVNADISLASDKAFNLGTASLRWNNLFVGTVDGGNAALALKTTASNASVSVNANGSGNFDVAATKFRRSVNGADTTNFIEDQYFDALTLTANVVAATEISSSLSFALASFDSAIIEYKIKEATSNKVRVGQFIVTTDGTIASSSDQFTESATLGSAVGLNLSADISGGNVRILYNNTNASNAATMRCNIRRIRT